MGVSSINILVHVPQRDVILYNLGIGATEKELQWTYEGSDEFAPLPTFGVIPQFPASAGLPLDWLPNYNPASIISFYVMPTHVVLV